MKKLIYIIAVMAFMVTSVHAAPDNPNHTTQPQLATAITDAYNNQSIRDAQQDIYNAGQNLIQDVRNYRNDIILATAIDHNTSRLNNDHKQISANMEGLRDLNHRFTLQNKRTYDQINGAGAAAQAALNSKPVAYDIGHMALGIGFGMSGDRVAFGIGTAARIDKRVSASATLTNELASSYNPYNISIGAGIQFNF